MGLPLVVPDLGFSVELTRTGNRFTATLGEDDLPAPGVEALLGQTLRIEVRDASGNASARPAAEPRPHHRAVAPDAEPAVAGSGVTYANPRVAPRATPLRVHLPRGCLPRGRRRYPEPHREPYLGIDPSVTSLSVATELAPGDYFWTLWVVDSFGNRSRSREAGFRVP